MGLHRLIIGAYMLKMLQNVIVITGSVRVRFLCRSAFVNLCDITYKFAFTHVIILDLQIKIHTGFLYCHFLPMEPG